MNEHKKLDLGRLSTAALKARRQRLTRRVLDLNLVLSGSLVMQSRRCGKAGCRCGTGDPHGPYTYLSSGGEGATRLRYVPKEQLEAVTRRLSATAALHGLLAEISAINAELLARRELD